MPGSKGPHHSAKWHSCWEQVQEKGHSAESAAAICTSQLGDESYEDEPTAAGGAGSGNFGHAGRPGKQGGSSKDGDATQKSDHPPHVQKMIDEARAESEALNKKDAAFIAKHHGTPPKAAPTASGKEVSEAERTRDGMRSKEQAVDALGRQWRSMKGDIQRWADQDESRWKGKVLREIEADFTQWAKTDPVTTQGRALDDAFREITSGIRSKDDIEPISEWEGQKSFSVRYWGDWETPADVSDEDAQDYDWQEPTQRTRQKLDEIVGKINARHEHAEVEWMNQGEKNWLSFHVRPKKKAIKTAEADLEAAGGPGSGNFGHAGRPGEVGGSADGEGGAGWKDDGGFEHTGIKWKQETDPKTGRPIPIKVDDIATAIELVHSGKVVEVKDIATAHTLITKLGQLARDAKAAGKEAKEFDLCQVAVPDTNMFCAESLRSDKYPSGVPRLDMPQLGGKAEPGSEADQLEKNGDGDVDGSTQFVDYLRGIGMKTSRESMPADRLRASQREIVGTKVAGMMAASEYDPGKKAVFVSSDDYVVDGHHRWAAVVGRDAEDGKLGDSKMNIIRINAPISEVLHLANAWSKKFGIQQKGGPSKMPKAAEGTTGPAGPEGEMGDHGRDWRHVHLQGAIGNIRTAQHEGREHLIVPVIALMEGVIHAINADKPEYVPIACLACAPQGWNGRPIVFGHPVGADGRQISANSPSVLQQHAMGTIFNTRIENKKLMMDAYVDIEKALRVGAGPMVEKLRTAAGMIEVSVGAFVTTENVVGTHNNRPYKARWKEVVPDHLAFLPKGVGACSNEMGCGTPRMAMRVLKDGMADAILRTEGGPGSGNFGHGGRPGSVGGSRAREGHGGTRTPQEEDEVEVMGKVHGAGKKGIIRSTAPSGSFHQVKFGDNESASYHSSDLRVTDWEADTADDSGEVEDGHGTLGKEPSSRLIDILRSHDQMGMSDDSYVQEMRDEKSSHVWDILKARAAKGDAVAKKYVEHDISNLGGSGSGNFSHKGRPGEVGGSASGEGGDAGTGEIKKAGQFTDEQKRENYIKMFGHPPKEKTSKTKAIKVTVEKAGSVWHATVPTPSGNMKISFKTKHQADAAVGMAKRNPDLFIDKMDKIYGMKLRTSEGSVTEVHEIPEDDFFDEDFGYDAEIEAANEVLEILGGAGSGNFGHSGRPGAVGGSSGRSSRTFGRANREQGAPRATIKRAKENAGAHMGMMNTDSLVSIIKGEYDINNALRHELAGRGVNPTGKWVGFDKAKAIFKPKERAADWDIDKDNVAGFLQTMDTDTLSRAYTFPSAVNMTRIAGSQLANRGLDKQGKWVGFDAAKRIHHGLYPAFNREGKRIWVTVPESDTDDLVARPSDGGRRGKTSGEWKNLEGADILLVTLGGLTDDLGVIYKAASDSVDALITERSEADKTTESTESEDARLVSLRESCTEMQEILTALQVVRAYTPPQACGCANRAAEGKSGMEMARQRQLAEGDKFDVDAIVKELSLTEADAVELRKTAQPRAAEGETMDRTEVIKDLCAHKHSGFTQADIKMLEAASDERLEQFRVAAAARQVEVEQQRQQPAPEPAVLAGKQLTEEQFLAIAPDSIRTLVKKTRDDETQRKAEIVASLKTAQAEYTESELAAMPLEGLERLARIAKVDMPVSYVGARMAPRSLTENIDPKDDVYANPPDPYAASIKALQTADGLKATAPTETVN